MRHTFSNIGGFTRHKCCPKNYWIWWQIEGFYSTVSCTVVVVYYNCL